MLLKKIKKRELCPALPIQHRSHPKKSLDLNHVLKAELMAPRAITATFKYLDVLPHSRCLECFGVDTFAFECSKNRSATSCAELENLLRRPCEQRRRQREKAVLERPLQGGRGAVPARRRNSHMEDKLVKLKKTLVRRIMPFLRIL